VFHLVHPDIEDPNEEQYYGCGKKPVRSVTVLREYGAHFCRNADTIAMQVFKKNVKGNVCI
jgi:hypothetical protein